MSKPAILSEIVLRANDLPASKAIFMAIMNLYRNPNASITDLENIVKNDMTLTTKILTVVNSSYYGLKNHVTNIEMAVRLLGVGTVKSIALATTVFEFVGLEHLINKNGLWMHSWVTGFISRRLAEQYNLPDKDLLFVTGLVHDIGKLILSKYLPIEYKLILARAESENIDEISLEMECLKFNHAQLGANVLRTWHFPEKVVAIVENHHVENFDKISDMELKCVAISNIITNQYGYTFLKNKYNQNIDPSKILNMSKENIKKLIDESQKSVPKFI